MTNAIRPGVSASLLSIGEAQTLEQSREAQRAEGSVLKRRWGASGGWRRNDGKVGYMNQRDLSGAWTVFMVDWPEEPPGQESEQP